MLINPNFHLKITPTIPSQKSFFLFTQKKTKKTSTLYTKATETKKISFIFILQIKYSQRKQQQQYIKYIND